MAGPLPLRTLPEGADRGAQRAVVRALLDVGIRTVIDLRTPAEPPSIRSLLSKLSDDAVWIGMPILDGAAPSEPQLEMILDAIDASLARERPVYVHCQGGRGRAGTVVAAWWIRHGHYDLEGALAALTERRVGQPHGAHPSPETGAQHRLLRTWQVGK